MSGDKKGLAKRTLICYHLDGWPGHFPSPRCALLCLRIGQQRRRPLALPLRGVG